MGNIDLDLSGVANVQLELEDLEGDLTTNREYGIGTNAEYGPFLEFGTQDMPPYPWFRPAVREFKANPKSFVDTSPAVGLSSLNDAPNMETVLKAVAASLANQMERNVTATESANRSPGTNPDHPKRETGNLVGDIGFERL